MPDINVEFPGLIQAYFIDCTLVDQDGMVSLNALCSEHNCSPLFDYDERLHSWVWHTVIYRGIALEKGIARRYRKPEEEKSPSGRVYFLRSQNDLVKIGFTRSPVSVRINAIGQLSPVPLFLIGSIPGTMKDETQFHHLFAAFRSHGEWFEIRGELAAYLKETFNYA